LSDLSELERLQSAFAAFVIEEEFVLALVILSMVMY
jgi:hypothetical protein